MDGSTIQVNVLSGLTADEVARLAEVCQEQTYQAGEQVFREGDEGEQLFIVRSGRVRISKAISLDVDRTLAVVGEGGVFGELAMVGEGVRSASAIAHEATGVLALTREGFLELTETNPGLGLQIMGRFSAMLAERLRLTTNLLRDTVNWGLEVSGAASLDLHHLMHEHTQLTVSLLNGEAVDGRLLKVDRAEGGTTLLLADDRDELHLIPYGAVARIRFARSEA